MTHEEKYEAALDFEPKKALNDNVRNDAVSALKTLNKYFEGDKTFSTAKGEKKALGKTRDNIKSVLHKDGYNLDDPSVQTALSLFIDNLSRL